MKILGVLLDLAGVVHTGDALLPGAAEALRALDAMGLPYRFVTNTSRKTRADLLLRLNQLGIEAKAERVYTAPLAARDWLAERRLRPHLLIHPALAPDFAGVTPYNPDQVCLVASCARRLVAGRRSVRRRPRIRRRGPGDRRGQTRGGLLPRGRGGSRPSAGGGPHDRRRRRGRRGRRDRGRSAGRARANGEIRAGGRAAAGRWARAL